MVDTQREICVIWDCQNTVKSLHLCLNHYSRLRSKGTTDKVGGTLDSFFDRVDKLGPVPDSSSDPLIRIKDGSNCWNWTGYLGRNGYGSCGKNEYGTLPHRVSYGIYHWELIDPSTHLDHLCRNHSCVNPKHLEPVTPQENAARGNAGINNRVKTHCPAGHLLSGDNIYLYVAPGRTRPSRYCKICIISREKYKAEKKRLDNAG